MKVSQLGEFGLIDMLARQVGKQDVPARLVLGIGDDAAVWKWGEALCLATTDTLVEGIHFTLDTCGWEDLGWKSIAINLSDIAAMGGIPQYALISLGLPPDVEVDSVARLYEGMLGAARPWGVAIVGGDTVGAPVVTITVTLLGAAVEGQGILSRSAARVGDVVGVTGFLGTSAAGLHMLVSHLSLGEQESALLEKAHLRPSLRVAEGQRLLQTGVKAAIDVSDGLVADLSRLCQASRVGARLKIESLPIHPFVRTAFPQECTAMALSGGEDYELLFCSPPALIEVIRSSLEIPVTVIGVIEPGKGEVRLIDASGDQVEMVAQGWEHFRSNPVHG